MKPVPFRQELDFKMSGLADIRDSYYEQTKDIPAINQKLYGDVGLELEDLLHIGVGRLISHKLHVTSFFREPLI